MEIALSPEQITKYVEKVQLYVNCTMKELRRLFLVQDIIDSIKVISNVYLHASDHKPQFSDHQGTTTP